MLNVVHSIYTLDEKVLIYAEYEDVLHKLLDNIDRYYELKVRKKWGLFAILSCIMILVSIVIAVLVYRQQLYIIFGLSLCIIVCSLVLIVFCLRRLKLLEQNLTLVLKFLERERNEIIHRDNETRALRLVERRGYNAITRVEVNKNGYCYITFDKKVYNKPCLIEKEYYNKEKNKIDLSIYDSYYTEVKKRINFLKMC